MILKKVCYIQITLMFSFLSAVTPHVGIIMGSDSDLPVMKDAAKILNMFDVPYEVYFS